MDVNSLSVTLYLLITLCVTAILAGVSITMCVRVLSRLTPSATEDLNDDYHGVELIRPHRHE
jgi:hypothetical protein